MSTALSLQEISTRIRALGRSSSGSKKRYRGKKAAIEAIRRKKQIIDYMMVRLVEEVSEVRARWSGIQTTVAAQELDRLTCVVARAEFMHRSLARSFAEIETFSVFAVNSCDVQIQSVQSLLTNLRLGVHISAARADVVHASKGTVDAKISPRLMLTA